MYAIKTNKNQSEINLLKNVSRLSILLILLSYNSTPIIITKIIYYITYTWCIMGIVWNLNIYSKLFIIYNIYA
jgi:hypothetical protein